jgi:hypothetical protein
LDARTKVDTRTQFSDKNVTLLKVHYSSITESKHTEMVEMLDKECQSLVFKMINDFREDLNKKMNEEKQSFQDLDEKFSNVDKKFSKGD